MQVPRRATIVSAACSVLIAAAAPAAALAHRGRGPGSHTYPRPESRYRALCAEAGVPLNGRPHGGSYGSSSLSEAQLAELKAACEKLATAYAAQRTADEAAANALREARKSARLTLQEACPALTEHRQPGAPWPGELSTACQEALHAYRVAVSEAQEAYRKARGEASKSLDAALSAFETEIQPIVEALEAVANEHNHRHEGGSGETPGGTAPTSAPRTGEPGPAGAHGPGGPAGAPGRGGPAGAPDLPGAAGNGSGQGLWQR